jgi:NADH:ubiquinone reductase (H+-translocating)
VGFLVQCLSLGRDRGVIQVVRADDASRRLAFGGQVAALVKEQVCRYTLSGLQKERSKPGSYRAVSGPRRNAAPGAGHDVGLPPPGPSTASGTGR